MGFSSESVSKSSSLGVFEHNSIRSSGAIEAGGDGDVGGDNSAILAIQALPCAVNTVGLFAFGKFAEGTVGPWVRAVEVALLTIAPLCNSSQILLLLLSKQGIRLHLC